MIIVFSENILNKLLYIRNSPKALGSWCQYDMLHVLKMNLSI